MTGSTIAATALRDHGLHPGLHCGALLSDRRCLAQSFTYTGAMAITSFSAKPEGMSHLLSVSL